MPSLIGNKPNQVPTNADLGTLAFQDANAVNITGGTASLTSANVAGNVGIGTTSPGQRLEVVGSIATIDGTYRSTNFANTVRFGAAGQMNFGAGGSDLILAVNAANIRFGDWNTNTERMRIDASGNLLVGVTSAFNGAHTILKGTNTNDLQLTVGGGGAVPGVAIHFGNNAGTANAANSVMKLGTMGATNRSISAAGTINASGADYAEYMTKAGDFTIAKGDVVGINAEGKLTNVFADAISFCVKSTDPSYVGGDVWGCGFDGDPEGLEAARQCVDRIAFAGQVPVNILGTTPGQLIVPVNDNGAIKGIAKNEADMTLAEYMKSVGRVIAVEADGRAKIIVKVA